MVDLEPATTELARIVEGVRDIQLASPTPCDASNVADLLDHVDGFCIAFTAAATKTPLPEGTGRASADADNLTAEWRTRIPERLAVMAEAWRDADAWDGMTHAGGLDLPGEMVGVIALDEVLVHGWDIAVASGQPFTADPALIEAALGFVTPTVAGSPEGTPGLFGPPIEIAQDSSRLDHLIALTGRDPAWAPDR
jgi:uncharacterized protein (TIGR03086 family)